MNRPTFIVGTGRCGSTMLSNILREHPDILSISEFFACVLDYGGGIRKAFASDLIDGKAFWNIIGAIAPRRNLLIKHDLAPPEALYPSHSLQSRFSSETGIPAILHIVLPHITKQYDDFFDEVYKYAIAQPLAPIVSHYKNLFNWLQKRFNKALWIERTGAILGIVEQIYQNFPDARFIHIVRDGRNSALSMSKHFGFRLFMIGELLRKHLGVDPYISSDRTNIDRLSEELKKFLPERFDRLAFLDYQVPLSLCGALWSQQIINGLGVLRQVGENDLITIVYEDCLEKPQTSLHKLTEFLGEEFSDEAWISRAAALVKKPRSSWQDLSNRDRTELILACQPGFDALNSIGIASSFWQDRI